MTENLIDPVVLFFVLGLLAGLVKSNLRLPDALYESLSIYLLLAIGLKGGVELAKTEISSILLPMAGALALGVIIPVIAYGVLRSMGKFSRPDAAAIAAHYGSVSAVTFAVAQSFLDRLLVPFEGFTTVLLVVMEIPAIAVGILIARIKTAKEPLARGRLIHEVLLNKSVFLLVGGLLIGTLVGPAKVGPVTILFFDFFKGALAFFLLEMGIVASQRLGDLKKVGPFLVGFGILMPLFSGLLGTLVGAVAGLSIGGTALLATLAASASYIAAPAAMRIAVPEANPTYYLTASLGVTFPFNLTFGIQIFYWMSRMAHGWIR
ncbi:MAG: sodium-dependent bicarbonate transport family permease [Elusimicrobiota bacterium]